MKLWYSGVAVLNQCCDTQSANVCVCVSVSEFLSDDAAGLLAPWSAACCSGAALWRLWEAWGPFVCVCACSLLDLLWGCWLLKLCAVVELQRGYFEAAESLWANPS